MEKLIFDMLSSQSAERTDNVSCNINDYSFDDIKEAGAYIYEKRLSQEIDSPAEKAMRENAYEYHYGKMRKARPPMYVYASEINLPDNEREIILQIFRTCVEPPTEAYRYYMANFNLTFERYYAAVLFLIPAANAPFDEGSIVSRIAHDENVRRDLDEISEILKEQYFYFDLSSKLKKLYADILSSEIGKKIHMYSEILSPAYEDTIRESVTCEFREVKNIIHKIPFPHTLDVVFGQDTKGRDILKGRYGEDSPYREICMMQREKASVRGNKIIMLSPLNEVLYLLGYSLLGLYPLSYMEFFISNSMFLSALLCAVLFMHSTSMLMYHPVLEVQEDRFVFRGYNTFHSERKRMHKDGIWSYCNFVQYGVFRKHGMKYIYYSKKHMTDDEFRKFKKKMILQDSDSVAVPYSEYYLRLAENLIFAERKDR
ncbi:MAG: hypothetical protein IKM61_04205 [Eubacteriaceae bacterium]|nr:hypothetical protein [Eubacteriaceae bacterium]